MTKNEVMELCAQVARMPFCQLELDEGVMQLTHAQYQAQMARPNHPWMGLGEQEAWYDDEASGPLQDAWYPAAAKARAAVREWESTHRGTIPMWAKLF